MKRRICVLLAAALAALLCAEPLAAEPLLYFSADSGTYAAAPDAPRAETETETSVRVNGVIGPQDAAERLYYLGLLSGVGTKDGFVDFALDEPMTRLSALVLTARLLGVERTLLAADADVTQPFTDVEAWGVPYVAWFWHEGLLAATPDGLLHPEESVSSDLFLSYMLYVLGAEESARQPGEAAGRGVAAGLSLTVKDALSRGDAVQIMFRTLNANCVGSEELLSERMVARRQIAYEDALFLLWESDPELIAAYIERCGYTTEIVLKEGAYQLTLPASGRCLNVAVDGPNRDYDGVPVTVWQETGDVTQSFRVVKTDRGTYRLFSIASSGGYNRCLTIYAGRAYLFAGAYTWMQNEFIAQYCDEDGGTWMLLSVADPTLALSAADTANGAAVALAPVGQEGVSQRWRFDSLEAEYPSGYEYALFPSNTVTITQGAYDDYSHQNQNAIDISPGSGSVFAPFTGKIVRIDEGWYRCNTVWLESLAPVVYADGTVDTMTMIFMHDNDISDLYVGQIIAQKEYFYDMGVAGGATGAHVHIACIRGKYQSTMGLTGSGDVFVQNALFVPKNATILIGYGLNWIYQP